MNIRNKVLASAILGAIGFSQPASAITIDGITFAAGSNFETIDLFQGKRGGGAITTAGDELVGIGLVNRILDADNNVLWTNGDNGRELTLHWNGYFAESFNTTAATTGFTDEITFRGGSITIYSDSSRDFTGAGTQAAGIASATDGNVFLSLTGSPIGGLGVITGDPITLQTSANRGSGDPFTNGTNLSGRGLLDVTGGSAASYFNTNMFGCVAGDGAPCPDNADKSFTSSGQLGFTGGWAARGTGEVQDFARVPEPATLALLGAGLVGMGFSTRRRAKVA